MIPSTGPLVSLQSRQTSAQDLGSQQVGKAKAKSQPSKRTAAKAKPKAKQTPKAKPTPKAKLTPKAKAKNKVQKGVKTKSKSKAATKAKAKAVLKKHVSEPEEEEHHEHGEEEVLEDDMEVEPPVLKRPAAKTPKVKAESSKAKSSVELPRQSRPPIVQPPVEGPAARDKPSEPVGEEQTEHTGEGDAQQAGTETQEGDVTQPSQPSDVEELSKEMEKALEEETLKDTKVDEAFQPMVYEAQPVVPPESTPTEPPTELYHAPDHAKSPQPAALVASAPAAPADPPFKRARTCDESQWFPGSSIKHLLVCGSSFYGNHFTLNVMWGYGQ